MRLPGILPALLVPISWCALLAGTSPQDPPQTPAQELIPHAQDRPPNPPKSPAEAIAAMTVPPGFTVELVAAEPDLVNPVSMTFDEKGRIWVTESLEYPRREPGPGRDRVKVLEDTDGDGAADKVTIFADGLNIPSGIAVGHGGVWVANSPDILFFPDADRDGQPDGPAEVVATGFGRDDTHELPNSLTWGPDGWLYGWNGVFNPSQVTSKNGTTYAFTCAIWRIHPRTREFQVWCEGTSNPWGIAINEEGEFFASACVIDHLWHLVEGAYYIRQGGPYPPFTYPHDSIVDHTHQKAAYCGITWFDSEAYPAEYRRKLYMGNIHGNCINVDTLKKSGATYHAEPAADFLSANDAWFMPVSQKTGPDGCLYILDWYDRYHCYQDANRDPEGIDRLKGRLYRVRYQDNPRRTGFDLAALTDAQLIQLLASANIYDRETAQRLLTERLAAHRAGPQTSAKLQALVTDPNTTRNECSHALWTLISAGPLDADFHDRLLQSQNPWLRAWAVRAAGNEPQASLPTYGRIVFLAADPDPVVRLQASIAIPKLARDQAPSSLLAALAAEPADPLVTHVAWQHLARYLDDPKHAATIESDVRGGLRGPEVARIWPRVLERTIASDKIAPGLLARLTRTGLDKIHPDPDQHRRILDTITAKIREGTLQGDRLKGLREALQDHVRPKLADGSDPIQVDYLELAAAWGDPEAVDALRRTLADANAHPAARAEALAILVARKDDSVLESVARVIADANSPRDFRERAITALGPLESPRVPRLLLENYSQLDRNLQLRAIELLTSRPEWTKSLLNAIAAKTLTPGDVNINQVRRLQQSRDPEITKAVRAFWGVVREGRNEQRDLVVSQMRSFLRSSRGNPHAGRQVFEKLCAQCHKIHGEGQEVGPEITLNGRNDFEQLISNVFDPNLVIGQGYQAANVATSDGRILTGLLVEDSANQVVLKIQGGQLETIPRADIEELSLSPLSLMPEELENQLTPQEIADLFAFLALDKPPTDPAAQPIPGTPPSLIP